MQQLHRQATMERYFPFRTAWTESDAPSSHNKTIFEEVGVEVPETIDELEDVCDKLLEAGYVPFTLANGSKWTGSMYLYVSGSTSLRK